MSKKRFQIIALLLGCFLTIEFLGRFYGLCDYPLYITSPNYEYMHAPNQKHVIYRNNFSTNAWSMRSRQIDKKRETTVVLLIGDSIINGGNLTDQDSLASTLLEKRLSEGLKTEIRVLNISAGSWGPDNAVAYLKEYGTFHADVMILVCSSHDAYDNMEFKELVGEHPQFPDQQVIWAWEKLLERGWQWLTIQFRTSKKLSADLNPKAAFNSGFSGLQSIAKEKDISMIVYLHPSLQEMEHKKYADSGNKIINFCKNENIPIHQEITLPVQRDHFRDHIHYSEKGQRFLAEQLFPILLPLFNN